MSEPNNRIDGNTSHSRVIAPCARSTIYIYLRVLISSVTLVRFTYCGHVNIHLSFLNWCDLNSHLNNHK